MENKQVDPYLESLNWVKEKNADNDLLGGYLVDEINGDTAKEMPAFVPTRHELTILLEYWLKEFLNLQFEFFLTGCTGSYEWRTQSFALRRIDRIVDLLSEDVFKKIEDEIFEQLKQQYDIADDVLKLFRDGTREEQRAYQETLWRNLED